jgi:membrane protein DedA with SNARE-associated domain
MSTSTQQLPSVIQAIAPFVTHYGYVGVGGLLLLENFGVPVPGETVLIAAAVFAGLGKLHIGIVIIVAIVASIIGDNIAFAVGRYGGHPLLERYGKYVFLTPGRIARTEAFYARNGARIVLIARFIDGLRQANGLIAGITEMKWQKFVTYNTIGATVWVTTWAMAGYLGASHVNTLLRYQLYLTILIFVSGAIFFLHKYRKRKSITSMLK